MSVIVTDAGFAANGVDADGGDAAGGAALGFDGPLLDWDLASQSGWEHPAGYGLDVPNTVSAEQLRPYFDAALIRISFPAFHDGRGFTIAQTLRQLGYAGRLRAHGHVVADQYAMARRCGFDDVEISDDLARRQPQAQWLSRADWTAHSYQARLRGTV